MSECQKLMRNESWDRAAEVCTQAFEATGTLVAGLGAAEAAKQLGRHQEALTWVDRLGDEDQATDIWLIAADVHRARGESELERRAYRNDLAARRRLGSHHEAALSAYNLFYLAWADGDFRAALDWARQTHDEAVAAADHEWQLAAFEALASVLYEIGDLERTERVLEVIEERHEPSEAEVRARLLLTRGAVLLDQGRYALSRDALKRALDAAPSTVGRSFRRSVQLNLTDIALNLGELPQAHQALAAALNEAEPDGRRRTALLYYGAWLARSEERYDVAHTSLERALGEDPPASWAWLLENEMGRVEEGRGEPARAEAAFLRAVEHLESLRHQLEIDELKTWLLERKRRPYEALFRLRATTDRPEAALEIAERAKARTFLDAFIGQASPSAEAEGDPFASSQSAVDRLDALQALLPAMSESPVVAPRPIDELLAAVRGRHILLYFRTGDELWAVAVDAPRVRTLRLAAPWPEIAREIQGLIAAPDDPRRAERLGALLLPEELLPPPGGRLHLVTDDLLGQVPFAALRRDGRYLIEDFVLAHVPSVTGLAAMSERLDGDAEAAWVLGDPRGDLPQAAVEAEEVAALLGAEQRLGEAATIAVLERVSPARVVHLATHTGLGPTGPWLMLADGTVSAEQVVAARLRCGLVVLASCSSAARPGRDLWGSLAAAFLASGSRAVLASLWSIDDAATRQLVKDFYSAFERQDAAAALASAQRSWIAAGRPPSEWAPFIFFGAGS